jgi:hypothetical protein
MWILSVGWPANGVCPRFSLPAFHHDRKDHKVVRFFTKEDQILEQAEKRLG